MANVDAAFGAKPVRHLTGGVIRATEYKIVKEYAANVFTGDFVQLAATGYVQVGAATNRLLGVFNGCKYTASNGEIIFKRYWPADTATLSDGDVSAYVYDDPNIVFAIQSSGSTVFADIGNLGNHVVTAGSTSTGQSKHEIDGTTGTGTAGLRVLGLYDEPKNAYGTNVVLETVIWEHELSGHDQSTAGV